MKKLLIFFIIGLLFSNDIYSQRRSTSVKGYYRKNGTYVRPHTRTYNSSSSNGSGSLYSTSSNENEETYELTSLTLLNIDKAEIKKEKIPSSRRSKGEIKPTSLRSTDLEEDGVVFYVSVLRYNGNTIDICPIKRDYSGDWDFSDIKHVINKKDISAEEALDLVSKHGWSIDGEILNKTFYYFSKTDLPKYLAKTTEAVKVK